MASLRSNPDSGETRRPGARERSRMRRRLRRQRQMREALLLDLGALVFELHRHGRREPELLQAKAAELTAVDEEVRALAEALGSDHTVMQLVATGVAGSCQHCGSLMSVDARYCASCGAPALEALGAERTTAERAAIGTAVEEQVPVADEAPEEAAYEEPPVAGPQSPEGVVAEEEALAEEETAYAEESAYDEVAPEAEEELAPEAEEELAPDAEGAFEPQEPDEDEFRVSRLQPEEAELQQPQPEEGELQRPQPEEEEAEPEEAEPEEADLGKAGLGAAESDVGFAGDGGRPEADEPPRALADDALDTAAKAIRSGLARGRDWLRGRRPEE